MAAVFDMDPYRPIGMKTVEKIGIDTDYRSNDTGCQN